MHSIIITDIRFYRIHSILQTKFEKVKRFEIIGTNQLHRANMKASDCETS